MPACLDRVEAERGRICANMSENCLCQRFNVVRFGQVWPPLGTELSVL